MCALSTAPCVVALAGGCIRTRARAYETADDIVAAHAEFVVLKRYARSARSCLSCDSHAVCNYYISLEFYCAAYIEYNDTV